MESKKETIVTGLLVALRPPTRHQAKKEIYTMFHRTNVLPNHRTSIAQRMRAHAMSTAFGEYAAKTSVSTIADAEKNVYSIDPEICKDLLERMDRASTEIRANPGSEDPALRTTHAVQAALRPFTALLQANRFSLTALYFAALNTYPSLRGHDAALIIENIFRTICISAGVPHYDHRRSALGFAVIVQPSIEYHVAPRTQV